MKSIKLFSYLALFLFASNSAFAVSTATCIDTDAVLMQHFNGTNGSTTFTDSSATADTFTANGNSQLSTTTPIFGSASLLLDGTGDYEIGTSTTSGNLGTADFTIDFDVKFVALPTAGNSHNFISHYTSGSYATNGSYLFFIKNTAGTYSLNWESYDSGDTTITKTWTTPSTGVKYHLAVIRTSGTIRIFVGGTQIGTDATDNHNLNQSVALSIGADSVGNLPVNGRMDELRIVPGTAIWTTTFTPPTAEYADSCPKPSFLELF